MVRTCLQGSQHSFFVSTFSQKVVILKVSLVFYFCEKNYYLGNYDIKKNSPPPLDLAALLFGLLTLHFFKKWEDYFKVF